MIRQANFELKYFALNMLKKHHVFEFSALFARTFNTVHQGILTLVIHVASTMQPIFTMSSVSLPKSVCSKLDSSLESSFGVMDDQMGQKFQWKWADTCKPRSKGGLGIRRMTNFNNALIAKLGRNVLSEAFSQSQKQILASACGSTFVTVGIS